MKFTVGIANTRILIHCVHPEIYNKCSEYLINGETDPDIEINMDESMIQTEYEQERRSGELVYGLNAAERILVQRKVAESMLSRDTLLMHGAVIAMDHVSYMFTGKSGTGKTTHIQKWLENVQGSFVVNGDKPMVTLSEKNAYACGTPWCGKENYGTNAIVPLRSIVFMKRSDENRIEAVSFREIFPELLSQTYQPANAEKMRKTLSLLLRLKDKVSFFRFYFDHFRDDAFSVSYNALTNQDRKA